MRKFTLMIPVVLLALAGCNSDSEPRVIPDPPPPPERTKLQVVHASPNAPTVNLVLNGNEIASGVDYKVATGVTETNAGTYTIGVDAILPDGSTVDAFEDVTADLAGNTIYSVLAVGDLANIEPLVITRSDMAPAAGSFRAQIVHAAPDAPMVDIYVTAPGADLATSSVLGSASFKEALGPVEVAEGDYQIRITVAGDPMTVVYDSGTVALAAGADLLIAAVENVGPGDQPVNLLVMGPDGASEILDASTPASVRVVHASADAPAVDVIANDNFAAPLIANLAFANFAGYVDLPADSYNVKVVPNGLTAPVVIDADLDLMAGMAYNVIALNELAMIEPLVLTADNRRVGTEAKLRIVHGSVTAAGVDIYLVAPGAGIDGATPVLSDVPFKADTNFLSVAEGSYDVIVTPTGTTDVAIGPVTINLTAGGIYTAIAVDAAGGGTPLGLILLDDFVAMMQTSYLF